MLNSLNTGIVGIRNQGTVDFDVFDQRERVLLHNFEEFFQEWFVRMTSQLFASGANLPNVHLDTSHYRQARAGGGVVVQKPPVRTSAQVIVAGFADLLFASRLAQHSRNFACQLIETLGHRYLLRTRYHLWRRAPDQRILARTFFRRALGVWRRGQLSSNLDTCL